MPDDPYSLGDLARLADVTPRTIRYYVAQGLLPSPEAAGPSTRYGEGHLARLRLIKRLQREHLPLAEIRARLEQMPDEEVIATVTSMGAASSTPVADRSEALDFVRSLMRDAGVQPRVREPVAPYDTPSAVPAPAAAVMPPLARQMPLMRREFLAPEPEALSTSTAAAVSPSNLARTSRSQWERIPISPDVEIHVRRPLDRMSIKRVDRLERFARELFEEEP